MSITRRQLLLGAAVASGAAATGVGAAALSGREPQIAVPAQPHLPQKLSSPKQVAVIGGGLAGLSAAVELAERGFGVTLFEAGSHCGGRVGAWSSEVSGVPTEVEHGFHAFFTHYYNLNGLIERACDPTDFIPVDRYPVAVKGRPIDELQPSQMPFPLNLLGVALGSKNLKLLELMPGGDHIFEFVRYDPQKTFERLDSKSFAQWCKEENVATSLFEAFYKPFARAMFNPLDELSAAEMIQLFHGYFIANPEGLGYRVARRPSSESLIGPLVDHLRALGVDVRTNAPVQGLVFSGDQLAGLKLAGQGDARVIAQINTDTLPDGRYSLQPSEEGPIFIGRAKDGWTAMDARCTHQGCPVAWVEEDAGFACPCHGGRYDAGGAPVSGPPKRPLAKLEVVESQGILTVTRGATGGDGFFEADHLVVAVDVKGLGAIAKGTTWPGHVASWLETVEATEVTAPYVVCRFWLDKPVKDGTAPLYTTAGYTHMDVLAVFDTFQTPSIEWAQTHGGSVVEAHAYCLTADEAKHPDAIAAALLEDIVEVLPELVGATVLHQELQSLDNFTAYGVGSNASRPRTTTPIDNLHLAGDWVRVDLPVALMERAVVSGKLAANKILNAEGIGQCAITTVPLKGSLA